MRDQEIPIKNLTIDLKENDGHYSKSIFDRQIKGIHIEHVVISPDNTFMDYAQAGIKSLYLFFKGRGSIIIADNTYDAIPESILLPNNLNQFTIHTNKNDSLHYLKISSQLSTEDLMDIKEFPKANTQQLYYTTFDNCQSYTEPIKSPNTISRTILPNKYIPRIAMGTVKTKGPDKVGKHKHPMLEQLFLGLSENNCTVYADGATQTLTEYSLLHIPLGSTHSVEVAEGQTLYYVWMDFFLNKEGEQWLETHIIDE